MMFFWRYSRNCLALWIFFVCRTSNKISGFQTENKSADLQNGSMSTRSAQSSLPNITPTCRMNVVDSMRPYLNGSVTSLDRDQFLLYTCHQCFGVVTNTKWKFFHLEHWNNSQLDNACNEGKPTTMTQQECVENVRLCCQNALSCCEKQIAEISYSMAEFCPLTWDGIMCFNRTRANMTIKLPCPAFIPSWDEIEYAEKHCLAGGEWLVKTIDNIEIEFTNYNICYLWKVPNELLISQFKFYFLIISLCLLFVSLIIFVVFKSLRSQLRIKIHINLFITLFFRCICELIINVANIRMYSNVLHDIAVDDSLLNDKHCYWITIFVKYFQNCTFSWMLCEALLLYQLLFRTFEQISGIIFYLFIGWCLPFIYTGIYVLIRKFHPYFRKRISKCWVEEWQDLEYFIRGPNILALMLNIIFLVNIIRLIRNLPTQPYDRSYWKRTLKAVLVLVPLFGLQLLLVAVSLSQRNPFYLGYTIIQITVQDSQGIAVSLAFCAFNQEVFNILRQKFAMSKCAYNRGIPQNVHNTRSHGSIHSRILHRSSQSNPPSVRNSNDIHFNLLNRKPVQLNHNF